MTGLQFGLPGITSLVGSTWMEAELSRMAKTKCWSPVHSKIGGEMYNLHQKKSLEAEVFYESSSKG